MPLLDSASTPQPTATAWIVSTYPARLFSRDQAITALTLAERLTTGFGEDDPFVKSWRKELLL